MDRNTEQGRVHHDRGEHIPHASKHAVSLNDRKSDGLPRREGLAGRGISLCKLRETALRSPLKVGLDSIARSLTRRTEPHVKLH
jgi:hypothetical protein